jgi:glycosyltransferase involved in cell wall biosynthesis
LKLRPKPARPDDALRHSKTSFVVMLLDNHHAPDARVAFEIALLATAGIPARVVAWDRRATIDAGGSVASDDLVRIVEPAPRGGGRRTLVALTRFSRKVWRHRLALFAGADLVIVHDIYLLPLGWVLAHSLRIPFIYDAHEQFDRAEALRYPSWFLRLASSIEAYLARSARAVLVPGQSRLARWDGVLDRSPVVVPNFRERRQAALSDRAPSWDLLYVGTISSVRRPDLLIALGAHRSDLRLAMAGDGHDAAAIEQATTRVSNVAYLGWREDVDQLFARTRCVYYGLDPSSPYSDLACPNTLYQALRHRKPLIFFCGGEPARLAEEFRIGIRCEPTVAALADAVDEALRRTDWQFDQAWQAVWSRADPEEFVRAVRVACACR